MHRLKVVGFSSIWRMVAVSKHVFYFNSYTLFGVSWSNLTTIFFRSEAQASTIRNIQKTGPNSSVICRACILDAPKFSKQFRHYALFFWVERFITSIDTNLSVVTLKMLRNIGVSTADSSGLERVRETLDFMRGFSSTKSLRTSDLTGMDWSVGPLGDPTGTSLCCQLGWLLAHGLHTTVYIQLEPFCTANPV